MGDSNINDIVGTTMIGVIGLTSLGILKKTSEKLDVSSVEGKPKKRKTWY